MANLEQLKQKYASVLELIKPEVGFPEVDCDVGADCEDQKHDQTSQPGGAGTIHH